VFGESVLNDAVAMVMYDTLGGFVGSHFTPGRAVAGAQRSVGNLNTLLVHAIFRTSK
jgi:NhaP-type Na+/H+ or K+/H+ antiporter